MKKIILFSLLICAGLSLSAQSRIDTLYYDKEGYGVTLKEFADYYRIAVYSDTDPSENKYRDFHSNGQIMSTGQFISLDAQDDRNSRFEGVIAVYDNKGDLSAIRNYSGGFLEGLSEEYLSDGTIIQEEFAAGKPAKEYYVHSDKNGNIVKIRYADNSVIWDSPDPSEISEDYYDGRRWEYYSKNGVTVALNTGKISDYGKYHVLNITISNNSLRTIEFEPSSNITASSEHFKKQETTPLKVYSCDDYIAKYDRRNAWASAIMGVSDVLTIIDAGVSETKTVTVNDKGEKSVSYSRTYDPFDALLTWELTNMETREYNDSIIEGREVRRVGYFKKTTIYPGESISGYAYVQRVKGDEITVKIDIEGAEYTYIWNYRK